MKTDAKKESIRRIKIIEGHVRKIREMVEKDEYCPNILLQTSAVSSALKRVDEIILDSHLYTCVMPALRNSKTEEPIKEILEVFKRR